MGWDSGIGGPDFSPGTSTDLGGIIGGVGGAVIGGIGNIISQNSANSASIEATKLAGEFNAAQAQKQMEFQEHMSNTAYQRAKNDMQAAGFNPIMAFGQGGASTPSGASGAEGIPDIRSTQMGDALQKGISTGIESMRLQRELRETDSRIALNEASEREKDTAAEVNQHTAKSLKVGVAQRKVDLKKSEAELPAITAGAQYRTQQAEIDKKMGYVDAITKRVTEAIGGVTDAVNLKRIWEGRGKQHHPNSSVFTNKKGERLDTRTGEYLD